MVTVMALLEVVGVASIMPFMSALADPEVVETNAHLNAVYTILGFEEPRTFLFFLGWVVFGALVLSISFKALTTYALVRYSKMREYTIGKRLVAGYLRQPYDWFLNRHSADLGKSILSEVGQVINQAIVPVLQLIAHGAVVVALVVLLIAVDPWLALAALAGLGGAYALIYLGLRGYLDRIGKDRVVANRERFEAVQEAFGGIKDVKVAALEGAMVHRFDDPARRFAHRQAGSELASQLPRFALEIIAFGGILAVVLYLMAARGSFQQAMPIIALYAFAGYRLMPALQQVYANLSKLRFAGAALDTLHGDLMSLGPDSQGSLSRQRPAPLGVSNAIELDHLHYTYPGAERPALRDLTLTIPARTTVGLVGATGSGKTTTVDIILGLLGPGAGELKVDGTPITAENVRAWQRTIGYVPQHIYLADDTVAANIAFGLLPEQIDQEAVERAARIANLHEFVMSDMPKRYATRVGERGVRLSGGQRQRIGIARALYHDPDLLVLDEATSALDNLTEEAVMEAVHNLGHRKTIVLIAHRLTTVQRCDTIYLLDKGELKGQGTFDELIKTNKPFRALARA
nr:MULTISPECIES: ABC transporter ATP-binding protein [unclassified Thioalkalivibrio]